MYYFSLAPHIFAAHYGTSIIILDSDNDKYLSMIDSAAIYLTKITQTAFQYDESKNIYFHDQLDTEQLNYWINFYLTQNYIVQVKEMDRKQISPQPNKLGGLCDYQWDTKSSWQPFKNISIFQIMNTFLMLVKVHWLLKYRGISGIITALDKIKINNKAIPTIQEINSLANAVDAASLIFPKKSFCLAWAATFTLLARQKQWDCHLIIGIQAQPFYAHAWADISGIIINDDPAIAQVLSIILRSPQA